MSLPRGIRNKNVGNIRKTNDKWKGLSSIQLDPDFFQFSEMKYGVRALAKLLLNYEKKYGLNTVASIINRYAPESENNTGAYILSVSNYLGVEPLEVINVNEHLKHLVEAITIHENGKKISESDINEGLALV